MSSFHLLHFECYIADTIAVRISYAPEHYFRKLHVTEYKNFNFAQQINVINKIWMNDERIKSKMFIISLQCTEYERRIHITNTQAHDKMVELIVVLKLQCSC